MCVLIYILLNEQNGKFIMNTVVKRSGFSLTNRQREVLKLVAKGYRNEDISKRIFVSVHTVKAHIASLYESFNVTSRVALVIKAIKLGLINLEDIESFDE